MTPIEGWSSDLEASVRALRERLIADRSDGAEFLRAAANRTGALPVYSDLGAILAITPAGDVIEIGHDGGAISPVIDEAWIRIARVAAAERYNELSELKPAGNRECETCGGTGYQGTLHLRCDVCGGAGRLD